MKYHLSPWEIPRAQPSGFPWGSGDISLYTPTLVTIQLQSGALLSCPGVRKSHCPDFLVSLCSGVSVSVNLSSIFS